MRGAKEPYQKDGDAEVEYGGIVASEGLIRQLVEFCSFTETNALAPKHTIVTMKAIHIKKLNPPKT
jgi:hypothetical protein